jgi:hypothetical protein
MVGDQSPVKFVLVSFLLTRPLCSIKGARGRFATASLLRGRRTEDSPFFPICYRLSNRFR